MQEKRKYLLRLKGYKKIAFKKAPTFWESRNFLKNRENDNKEKLINNIYNKKDK